MATYARCERCFENNEDSDDNVYFITFTLLELSLSTSLHSDLICPMMSDMEHGTSFEICVVVIDSVSAGGLFMAVRFLVQKLQLWYVNVEQM